MPCTAGGKHRYKNQRRLLMRVALIGCGLAAKQHILAIKSYKGAKVVGVADIDEERLTAFGEKYCIDAQFKNFKEMIERVKPEVVHIVTPPPTHATITKDVLALGCAVLVEKPMCMDETEADTLFDQYVEELDKLSNAIDKMLSGDEEHTE